MTDTVTPPHGLLNVGEQAKPPFAVLPDPKSLFKSRGLRFRALASGHDLAPYLTFLAGLSDAQHRAALKLDAADAAGRAEADQSSVAKANFQNVGVDQASVDQALAHGLAPLGASRTAPGAGARAAIAALLAELTDSDMPETTREAVRALATASPDELDALASKVLNPTPTGVDDDVARSVLAFAGLQVHFARLAATLPSDRLSAVNDPGCPACASAPVSSAIVGWPRASNTRFCSCSLCATMWNVVRVKCVLCNETGGISYRAVEGKPDTVKAECCEACRAYVKLLNQTMDPALDAVADDVATLGLDMLMADEGWKRGALNPFLMGY